MRIELAVPQDFLDLLSATEGIFYGDIESQQVRAVCTDSRECEVGDVFFALRGKNFDGNNFIPEAIKRGAIPVGNGVGRYGIRVDSADTALLSFAAYYKNALPNLKHTVAITGSVGKTTTKEFLHKITNKEYKTHATWGNYNNKIGVSMTVLSAPKDTEVLILEMGMNHSGEIKNMASKIKADTAIITKIGTSHIGYLENIENIAKAKLEITCGLQGELIIPKNEPLLKCNYEKVSCFSSDDIGANISIIKNRFDKLELYIGGSLYSFFDFPSKAEHIRQCLAAAVAGALKLVISKDKILEGIKNIKQNIFRHKILNSRSGFLILDDSYNSSYESLTAALETLKEVKYIGKASALIGDILELGNKSAEIHYKIGKLLAAAELEYLFLVGEHIKETAKGAIDYGFVKSHIFLYSHDIQRQNIARQIIDTLTPADALLVKASHGMKLKNIIEIISE